MSRILALLILFFHCSVSYADKNMKIGFKGKESDINRVIKVKMYDNYYAPNSFQIKAGETIKFEVENVTTRAQWGDSRLLTFNV